MKDLILDAETTGLLKPNVVDLTKQPKIIELGIIVVTDGKITGEFNWLVNPGEQITAEITKITGITNEMLVDKPSFENILKEVRDVFTGADRMICHNASYDHGMMKNELARLGITDFVFPPEIICTVQEYKHLFGGKWPKMTLLYEKIIDKPLEQTHRASDDCKALCEILTADGFFELKI